MKNLKAVLLTFLIFIIVIFYSCDERFNKLENVNTDSLIIDSFLKVNIRKGIPNTRFPGIEDNFFPFKYSIIDTFFLKSLSCIAFVGGVYTLTPPYPYEQGDLFLVLKDNKSNLLAIAPYNRERFLSNEILDSPMKILKRRNSDINNIEWFLNHSQSLKTMDKLDNYGLDSLFKIYLALRYSGRELNNFFRIKSEKELDSVILANPIKYLPNISKNENLKNIDLFINYLRSNVTKKNFFIYFDTFFYHLIEVNTGCDELEIKKCYEREEDHSKNNPIFFSNSSISVDHYSVLVNHAIFARW